jgi:hypothetical protein
MNFPMSNPENNQDGGVLSHGADGANNGGSVPFFSVEQLQLLQRQMQSSSSNQANVNANAPYVVMTQVPLQATPFASMGSGQMQPSGQEKANAQPLAWSQLFQPTAITNTNTNTFNNHELDISNNSQTSNFMIDQLLKNAQSAQQQCRQQDKPALYTLGSTVQPILGSSISPPEADIWNQFWDDDKAPAKRKFEDVSV